MPAQIRTSCLCLARDRVIPWTRLCFKVAMNVFQRWVVIIALVWIEARIKPNVTYLTLGTEEDSSLVPRSTLQNLAAEKEAEKAANCVKFVSHMLGFCRISYLLCRILTESRFPVNVIVWCHYWSDQWSVFCHTKYKGKQKEIVEAATSGESLGYNCVKTTNYLPYRIGCLCISTYGNGQGICKRMSTDRSLHLVIYRAYAFRFQQSQIRHVFETSPWQ